MIDTITTIICRGCGAEITYTHGDISENVVCPKCGWGHTVTRTQFQDWGPFAHEYYAGHIEFQVQ